MNRFVRGLLGVIAHVPLVGVLGLATWLSSIGDFEYLSRPHVEDLMLTAMVAVFGLAFFQMMSAVPFIALAATNKNLSTGAKIAWSLFVVFVGSIGQPLYFWTNVFGAPREGGT